MKPERWRQVKSVFDVAVELEGDDRRAFLNGRDEDPELLDEVRELLAADGEETRFLEPMDLDLSSLAALAPDAGDRDQDDEPLTGSEIEHFVVGRRLGVGGMGEVYSGFDTKLQREVALKAIRRGQRMDTGARGRFLREARILSNLDHPGICRIYDYVESETCDLLVLELIAGHSLRHVLAEPLSHARRLSIAEQISAALAAAHAEGIVHRDLKPSNVMLTESDEVKVLDFGLARAWNATSDEEGPAESEVAIESLPSATGTQTLGSAARFQTAVGLITGTPSAMSPEQLHGEQATPASDMYSFGLLLQELFTGKPPYDPELTLSDLLQRAKRGDTRPARGIDKHLAALIESLKSTQVRDRATAAQASERLAWIRRKPQRRLRAALAAGAVAIILAAALKYTVDLSHERTAAVAAQAEADRRRGQAEELIGYMLGDLRGKLEPIGRLEILDDVGDRALDYFAAVPEAELSDDELHSRSLALAQIGEVRTAQGDLEAAQRAFDESLVLARGLAERRPENTDYLAGLGAAHFWVGTVHWRRSESEPALAEFHRYLEVAERLVARDAESSEWLMELSYAESNIGVVEKATGHRERALTRFHRALALNQQVVDREPGNASWLSDLADARSWVAETLAELGNLETALAEGLAYQQSVLELAAAHPGDAQLRRMAADTHDNVGSLLLQRGDLARAEQEFAAYETAFSDLVGLDVSNNDWRFALAIAGRRRGELLLEQGRPQQAAERLALAGTQFAELLAVDASNLEWSYQAGVCSALEAAALVAADAPAAARTVVQRLLEQVAAGVFGELDDESVAALRAHAFLVAGDSRVASGQPAAGREAYDSALAAVSSLPQPAPNVTSRDLHAQILLRLGRSAEAQSILDALERSGYRRTFLRSTVATNKEG